MNKRTCKRARGYDLTPVKDESRLDVRRYSLSQRTIREWNKLSKYYKKEQLSHYGGLYIE